DFAPIGFKRYNKKSGDEVPWGNVVKGYEYEKGQYVVLTDEDFRRANVKASQTIEIETFVPASSIPAPYFETPYYLVPGARGAKAKAAGVSAREMELAQRLIDDLSGPWKPEQFKDTYHEDLMNRIEEKIKRGETKELTEPEKEAGGRKKAEVIDLMELLKQSITKGGRKGARATGDTATAERAPVERAAASKKRVSKSRAAARSAEKPTTKRKRA